MAFIFILAVLIFSLVVLISESTEENRQDMIGHRDGLWHWLTTGNWSAKVGGGLLIIGIGALLRYALLYVPIHDAYKLGAGVALSIILAGGALALQSNPKRRAVCLSLAGTSLAVAYLTAFSAYSFFNYLPESIAFNILVIVCVVGAVLAVQANALSIAILAMFGAYLAPVFALTTPAPLMSFGYFMAISLLCLFMIWQRGWRPLMHLSFLFTMVGALRFNWFGSWHYPDFFPAVSPEILWLSLLGLQALHLGMLFVQNRSHEKLGMGKLSLDRLYLLAVAAISVALVFSYVGAGKELIFDTVDGQRAWVLLSFALLWAMAALPYKDAERIRYVIFAGFFALIAAYLVMPDIPWSLWILALSVLLFYKAPQLPSAAGKQELICLISLVAALFYMSTEVSTWTHRGWLTYSQLIYNTAVAGLLLYSGHLAKQRGMHLPSQIGWLGALWAGLTILHEVMAFDLPPSVMSLMVIVLGTGAVLGAHHQKLRVLWITGIVLMLGGMIKMVFLDFDSLGQLANILAIIGAGALFLLISWLAPYPPAADKPASEKKRPLAAETILPAREGLRAPDAAAPAVEKQLWGMWSIILGAVYPIAFVIFRPYHETGFGSLIVWLVLIVVGGVFALLGLTASVIGLIKNEKPSSWIGLALFFLSIFITVSFITDSDRRHAEMKIQAPARETGMGMTWGYVPHPAAPRDAMLVSCHGDPAVRHECNAYHGDTSCEAGLPVLCIQKNNLPVPADLPPQDRYSRWSGGVIATTHPMRGTMLTSRKIADNMCQNEFGPGWRMAEHHDGWGWGFWAKPQDVARNRRFWVAINGQPANCWDH